MIVRLWRYPVKSMLGEECGQLELDQRGVIGDRVFAILDADGHPASGKTTRRFRKIDGLLQFRAVHNDDVLSIVFPDGRSMRADSRSIDAALSEAVEQPVTLARETTVPYLDAGALHLITTASLRWLQALLPQAAVDERRFRPNVLIHMQNDSQIEGSWLGKTLCIGNRVRLRVTGVTERCPMVNFAHADLRAHPEILTTLARSNGLRFGVYAQVLEPGTIKRTDRAVVVD